MRAAFVGLASLLLLNLPATVAEVYSQENPESTAAPAVDRSAVIADGIEYLRTAGQADHGRDAKAVCAQCPVVDLCLEHALGVREKEGIWGGCTERERRRIIRQRRRSA